MTEEYFPPLHSSIMWHFSATALWLWVYSSCRVWLQTLPVLFWLQILPRFKKTLEKSPVRGLEKVRKNSRQDLKPKNRQAIFEVKRGRKKSFPPHLFSIIVRAIRTNHNHKEKLSPSSSSHAPQIINHCLIFHIILFMHDDLGGTVDYTCKVEDTTNQKGCASSDFLVFSTICCSSNFAILLQLV